MTEMRQTTLSNTWQVLFKSAKTEWQTPPYIFNPLNDVMQFTIDSAASPENNMLERYLTIDDDTFGGFSWATETVWCNPPYGRNIAVPWLRKIVREEACACVLLPARTDTKMFHSLVFPYADYFLFLSGRIKFLLPGDEFEEEKKKIYSRGGVAPFPSVAVFYNMHHKALDPSWGGFSNRIANMGRLLKNVKYAK